jgi:uncharacterized protein YdaU (DUF1376 family)
MADFRILPLWTDAYLADTGHLTPAENSAYLLLLMAAWRTPDCSLPNDDKQLGRMARDPKNWSRVKPAVMAFWTLGDDGRWRQKRLTKERAYTQSRSKKQGDKARARWSRGQDSSSHSEPDSSSRTEPDSSSLNTSNDLTNNEPASLRHMPNGCRNDASVHVHVPVPTKESKKEPPTPLRGVAPPRGLSTLIGEGDEIANTRQDTAEHVQAERDGTRSDRPPVGPPLANGASGPEREPETPPEKGRGTRLPKDWTLTPALEADAVEARERHGLPPTDLYFEADKFANYYHGLSGQRATKRDWRLTWINWALRAEPPRGAGQQSQPFSTTRLLESMGVDIRGQSGRATAPSALRATMQLAEDIANGRGPLSRNYDPFDATPAADGEVIPPVKPAGRRR